MKLSLLFCFLSLFLTISCGSDNDDDDDVTVNPPTSNEDDREEENDDVVSKYTSVLINANGFYDPNYTHSLRADLGRRPVILTGNFEETPVAQDGTEGAPVKCSFAVNLSEEQADRLERLANKLKICTHNSETGDEIVNFVENDLITLTERNGRVTEEAFKSYIGDFDMNFDWICGGRSAFYSNMKALVRNKLPENCPPGALKRL